MIGVSEKTIYRWIRKSGLPAFSINGQYRFHRIEVLEWATSHRINLPSDAFCEANQGNAVMPNLEEAIKAGGIYYRISGTDRDSVLQSTVAVMPLPEEVDKSFLLRVLVARESLGSTGVGNGIAIPHMRNPIVMHIPRPMVTLCFLEHPIEFGAIDGKPVHTIFTLVSPTTSEHLRLLSTLAFSLRHPAFSSVIARQGNREEILSAAAESANSAFRRSGSDQEGDERA